jgi:hypothetical protein
MNTLRSIAAVLLAAALIAAGAARPRPAEAGNGDNIVVAVNPRDDARVFRVSLAIRRVTGDTVDGANVAFATSSCADCQTFALAFEAILAFDDPSVFTPLNLAIAMNVGCSGCETLASAYQWLTQTHGPAHFTPSGNQRIASLRRQLQLLRTEELSIWDVQLRADAIAQELADVLATELVLRRG